MNNCLSRSRANVYLVMLVYPVFCPCGLDFNLMTLIYDYDLDILKMYLHIEMNFLGEGFRKLEHEQNKQQKRFTIRIRWWQPKHFINCN